MEFKDTRQVSVRESYDVVVVGGGIAGVAAAVSAARNGCSKNRSTSEALPPSG